MESELKLRGDSMQVPKRVRVPSLEELSEGHLGIAGGLLQELELF